MSKNKLKVLVVDDDEMLADIIRSSFESFGCEASVVHNGLQALEFISNNEVTFILSDIQMPQMDGIAMLKEINKRGIKIPVFIMSGFSQYSAEEIKSHNGVGLLKKPFTRDQLKEIVEVYSRLLKGVA